MPNLENLRKQAKQLVRWHREQNYSVAARIRTGLPRYRDASDADILAGPFALAEAQLLLACEAGFETWAELTSELAGAATMTTNANTTDPQEPMLVEAEPQLFVSDIRASCAFFEHRLGFAVVFTHGEPPFYGQVARGQVRLNLRLVCEPVYAGDVREREQLLAVSIRVGDVKALYTEYTAAGVEVQQPLKRQPWGALQFVIRDPDGNLILFSAE